MFLLRRHFLECLHTLQLPTVYPTKDNSRGRAKFHQRAASTPTAVPFVTTNVLRWLSWIWGPWRGIVSLLGPIGLSLHWKCRQSRHQILAPGCKCGKSNLGLKCAWQEEQRKWDEIFGGRGTCCKGSLLRNIHLCSCGVLTSSSPQYIHHPLTHINNVQCFQRCKALVQLKVSARQVWLAMFYYSRTRLKLQVSNNTWSN